MAKQSNVNKDKAGSINTSQKCWSFIKELNSHSEERLDSVALSCAYRDFTYRQMFSKWERYAGVFSGLGIDGMHGSRVGMTDIPSAEAIFAFYSLNMTGASVSMMHSADVKDEVRLGRMIREEGITDLLLSDLVTDSDLLERIIRSRQSLGIRRIIVIHAELGKELVSDDYRRMKRVEMRRMRELRGVLFMDELLERYEGFDISISKKNDETAYIAHTSGTVNCIHKPVPLSDRGLNEAAAMMLRDKRFKGLRGRAVSALFSILSSAYAMADMVHMPLAFGGRLVLMTGLREGEDIVRAMTDQHVNVMFTQPSFMDGLMRSGMKPDLSELEFVFLGGSYVSAYAKGRYDGFLASCGARIRTSVGYGISEAAGAVLLADPDSDDDSMGKPLAGVRVKLKSEEDGSLRDPSDGPCRGIIYISSPSVSSGRIGRRSFFRLENADGEKYLNTYDLAEADADGRLYYAGRADKFFVNNEGIRFDAGLIERAVSAEPGIEACGMAPNYDKSIHDTVPVLYVCTSVDSEADERSRADIVTAALKNVFLKDGLIKKTNLPGQCLITKMIPYSESGKVDSAGLARGRAGGRLYRVAPVKKDGALSDIKLELFRDSFGRRSGRPDELDKENERASASGGRYSGGCIGRQGRKCHRNPWFCPYGDQCPKTERADREFRRTMMYVEDMLFYSNKDQEGLDNYSK